MLRSLFLLALLGAVVDAGAGCSLFLASDGDDEDQGALAVTAVDGDGSARAVVFAGDVDGGAPADHRVDEAFVVAGRGFDGVTDVHVVDEDGRATPLPFTVESAVRLRALASLPHAGLFTLVVAGAGAEARAQVFVLQGEPGPPQVSALVAARADECRFGGKVIASGADGDGDGALDDDEIQARLAQCDTVVTGEVRVDVASVAELRQALIDLDAVRIGGRARVDLQLPAGDFPLGAEPLRIDHADGRRVRIRGETGTRLLVDTGRDGIVVDVDGVRLQQLAVVHEGAGRGNFGVVASNGAVVVIDDGVTVDGFVVGVGGHRGGIVEAGAVDVIRCNFGVQALYDGAVFAVGASVVDSDTGFSAFFGGTVEARGTTAQNCIVGYQAQAGSMIDADGGTVDADADVGVIATLGSYARADGLHGEQAGVHAALASLGSVVEANDVDLVRVDGAAFDVFASRGSVVFARGGNAHFGANRSSVVVVDDVGVCSGDPTTDGQCAPAP